jgi:hypothetical protein
MLLTEHGNRTSKTDYWMLPCPHETLVHTSAAQRTSFFKVQIAVPCVTHPATTHPETTSSLALLIFIKKHSNAYISPPSTLLTCAGLMRRATRCLRS